MLYKHYLISFFRHLYGIHVVTVIQTRTEVWELDLLDWCDGPVMGTVKAGPGTPKPLISIPLFGTIISIVHSPHFPFCPLNSANTLTNFLPMYSVFFKFCNGQNPFQEQSLHGKAYVWKAGATSYLHQRMKPSVNVWQTNEWCLEFSIKKFLRCDDLNT